MLQDLSFIIRDVIIIIVAATFIEMLLPRNEFHRYIRMVVGLLIILVLLSSVQDFIRMAPPAGSALQFYQFRQEMPPEADAALFKQRLETEYRARMQEEAKRVGQEATQAATLVRAEVALQSESDYSFQVKTIKLYLSEEKNGEGTEISPVVIEINPSSAPVAVNPRLFQEGLQVQARVARHFQLRDEQVEIVFLEG